MLLKWDSVLVYFPFPAALPKIRVILSERSESKNLRINETANLTLSAKILRLRSFVATLRKTRAVTLTAPTPVNGGACL